MAMELYWSVSKMRRLYYVLSSPLICGVRRANRRRWNLLKDKSFLFRS
jgi:hypothetical protein